MSLSSPSGGQGDNFAPLIRQREPTYCCSLFLRWLFNEEALPHPRLAAGTAMLQSKPMRPRRSQAYTVSENSPRISCQSASPNCTLLPQRPNCYTDCEERLFVCI